MKKQKRRKKQGEIVMVNQMLKKKRNMKKSHVNTADLLQEVDELGNSDSYGQPRPRQNKHLGIKSFVKRSRAAKDRQ